MSRHPLQILRVDIFCPAASKFGVHGSPGEIQPRLIDVGAKFVGAGHPDHHWRRLCSQHQVRFTLPAGKVLPLQINRSEHDPGNKTRAYAETHKRQREAAFPAVVYLCISDCIAKQQCKQDSCGKKSS